MARTKQPRRRHLPQRTCVGCRQVLTKRELVRVVRSPEGVVVDPTGRQPGRGAYIHNQRSCWELALKGSLARSLKVTLTEADRERLAEYLDTIPEEVPATEPE